MDRRHIKTSSPTLPSMQDPSSWGVIIVNNVSIIIGLVLASLGLVSIMVASVVQLDVTIKTNVSRAVGCDSNPDRRCVQLQVTEKQARQISISDSVGIEVMSAANYRRRKIDARVLRVVRDVEKDGLEPPYIVDVELNAGSPLLSDESPSFAMIIVGSQSALDFFRDSVFTEKQKSSVPDSHR